MYEADELQQGLRGAPVSLSALTPSGETLWRTRLVNMVPKTLEVFAAGVNSSVLGCDCRRRPPGASASRVSTTRVNPKAWLQTTAYSLVPNNERGRSAGDRA